jgi:TolB-like protein
VAEGDGEEQTTGAHSGRHEVFISYASHDTAVANDVAAALEGQSLKCWIAPRDVTPGAHYASEIVHAIDSAKAIILILSLDAATSPHVLREIERATSKRHPVVTLRLDQAPLPAEFEYFLNTSQWLDASSGEATRMMPKLVAAVRLAIERSVGPARAISATPVAVTPAFASDALSGGAWFRDRTAIIIGSILAVAIAGFAAYRLWVPGHRVVAPAAGHQNPAAVTAAPAIPEKSVAVLPFVDMSEKKDQEYFSDGLSEELIDHLARAPDLKVIARTSSFQFKGKNEDTHSIGKHLGVANLLEGSVRKSGDTLRISVQLVRAETGYHIWSETYDRRAGDIFKVQDEIAAAVLQALKTTLLEDSASKTTRTQNIEAYALYLQGHAIYQRANTQSDYDTAIDFFHRSLKADPNYARAWAALSSAITVAADNEFLPLKSAKQDARQAAERALALDPGLADAHVAMARYLIAMELDVGGGESQIRRALELEPNHSGALAWAGKLASWRGQFDQATALIQRSITSDPLDPNRYADLAANYYFAGKYVDALNSYHKALAFREDSKKHLFPAAILLAEGDPVSALKEIDREGDEKVRLACWCRALALDALGRKAEADVWLADMIKNHADDGPSAIGFFYASRGNVDEAFNWFDRAYRERDPEILDMKVEPLLKNVQSDPRFTALLKKLGLER